MKFSDFIQRDSIIAELENTTKPEVIREMVQALVKIGAVPEAESDNIYSAIMRREELGTTGIGNGIAVPHTKSLCVEGLVGAVAVSSVGVDFDSLDGEKVHLIFLLISPTDRPGEHLRALEYTTINLKNPVFLNALKNAESSEQIWESLSDVDSQ